MSVKRLSETTHVLMKDYFSMCCLYLNWLMTERYAFISIFHSRQSVVAVMVAARGEPKMSASSPNADPNEAVIMK